MTDDLRAALQQRSWEYHSHIHNDGRTGKGTGRELHEVHRAEAYAS